MSAIACLRKLEVAYTNARESWGIGYQKALQDFTLPRRPVDGPLLGPCALALGAGLLTPESLTDKIMFCSLGHLAQKLPHIESALLHARFMRAWCCARDFYWYQCGAFHVSLVLHGNASAAMRVQVGGSKKLGAPIWEFYNKDHRIFWLILGR